MMRRALGQIEASSKLVSNSERVITDITNPQPITQPNLQRVSPEETQTVRAMVREVCGCLLGKKLSVPSTPGAAKVWAKAAIYFHGRIQASANECQNRNPDMSPDAATAMRTVLAQISNRSAKIDTLLAETTAPNWEAAQKLVSNRERIVRDITNPGFQNIDGYELTQTYLERVVEPAGRATVDAMITEVCCRLLFKTVTQPSQEDLKLWAAAARYLSGRIQGTPQEKPGRNPDMSPGAAAALRAVLQQI